MPAPRITARVDDSTLTLLQRAAAIKGCTSINSFVLQAAVAEANSIVEKESTLTLSREATAQLMEALDRPARIHPKLQAAAKRQKAQGVRILQPLNDENTAI